MTYEFTGPVHQDFRRAHILLVISSAEVRRVFSRAYALCFNLGEYVSGRSICLCSRAYGMESLCGTYEIFGKSHSGGDLAMLASQSYLGHQQTDKERSMCRSSEQQIRGRGRMSSRSHRRTVKWSRCMAPNVTNIFCKGLRGSR